MNYFIGIDGGATSTRAVVIDSDGNTRYKKVYNLPSNLSIEFETTSSDILTIIDESVKGANIQRDDITRIGIGVAGASNKEGRDFLFGLLDQNELGQQSLIMSDIESAFEITSVDNTGLLVIAGTGVNILSKDSDGKIFTAAGAGHDEDLGSGFWIGRDVINKIGKNESAIYTDDSLHDIFEVLKDMFDAENFSTILEEINSGPRDLVAKTASIAKPIIDLAEGGNEFALSVIQQAAMHISDYIILVTELEEYKDSKLTVLGNGSLLKNIFFRNIINQSLRFHFKEIGWIFSDISSCYGSAIISARSIGINISTKSIIESGDFLGP